MSCECCECIEVYGTLAACEKISHCLSGQLDILFKTKNDWIEFELKTMQVKIFPKDYAHDGDSDNLTRTTCMSEVDYHWLDTNDYSASFDLLACNATIIKSGDKHAPKEAHSFGHSRNQMLQNTCDDYAICSTKLIPGTKQRNDFDLLFLKMRNTRKFENSSSYQHDALCWWLEDMKHFSESSTLIQRYLLAILYYHTDGVNWNNSINWLTHESECEWHGAECDECSEVRKLNLLLNKFSRFTCERNR